MNVRIQSLVRVSGVADAKNYLCSPASACLQAVVAHLLAASIDRPLQYGRRGWVTAHMIIKCNRQYHVLVKVVVVGRRVVTPMIVMYYVKHAFTNKMINF